MKIKKIPFYSDISGNTIGIQTYEYGSGENGLYLQGGVHGGEITYFIFHELSKLLLKLENKLQKKVLLAPLINPPAWNQRAYYYTAGKFDFYKGADWNRSYPGESTSMSSRNSKVIFDLAQSYPFAIDLHTARQSKPYAIFSNPKLLSYIKILGLPYNLQTPQNSPKYKGTFHEALTNNGTNALTLESGSHDSYESDVIRQVVSALLRLLEHLGILQTNQEPIQSVSIVTEIETIYSATSGFAKYALAPQQFFSKGDILGEIYTSESLKKIVAITAPFDGLLFELPRTHIVWVGDELFRIINKKNLKKL